MSSKRFAQVCHGTNIEVSGTSDDSTWPFVNVLLALIKLSCSAKTYLELQEAVSHNQGVFKPSTINGAL